MNQPHHLFPAAVCDARQLSSEQELVTKKTQYTTVNNAMAGASVMNPNSTVQSNANGGLTYSGTMGGGSFQQLNQAGIKKVLTNLIPNVAVQVKINLVYSSFSVYIAVREASAQSPNVYSNLLYSTMTNGSINFTFMPTQSSAELSMELIFNKVPIGGVSYIMTLDSVSYMQETGTGSSIQLMQVSNKLNDGYIDLGLTGKKK
jgi:hypothetical protein